MKWEKNWKEQQNENKRGSTRIRKRFLLTPLAVGLDTRWLEFVAWEEEYIWWSQRSGSWHMWSVQRWADEETIKAGDKVMALLRVLFGLGFICLPYLVVLLLPSLAGLSLYDKLFTLGLITPFHAFFVYYFWPSHSQATDFSKL